MEVKELVLKEEANMIKIRRDLHKIPELDLKLPNTVAYVKNELDKMGINYYTLIDGNAIVAEIKGSGEGKCIAIRADMDALPVKEETGLEFSSGNDNMHACGHDGHTAMALGACRILNQLKDKFKGSVKFLFQPGEEYSGGAKPMIDGGCMKNPKVDAVIGLHQGNLHPEIPKGKIGVRFEEMMASMDTFSIRVKGKGAHGASYHEGIDPITIAAQIINSLQLIISREIAPTTNKVLSICQIHGGSTHNIIPDEVFMEGTVRATDDETRKFIANRIEEVATNIAKANRTEAVVEYDFKYPAVINDDKFTEFFGNIAKNILGEDSVVNLSKPTMGGEDMAYFLQEVPGTFFFLSNIRANASDEIEYPHHNSKFDVDESYFKIGTELFVETAIAYLNESE